MTRESRQVRTDEDLETLLHYLKRTRGFDFTGYKRATLQRRIDKRVQTVGAADLPAYLDYLEVHPEEFARLFDTILINVTSFFRDAASWNYLMTDIIPQIVAAKPAKEPIRIWSAGCATGEEAYTLVMAFCEVMGIEQFRESVKVYATDADDQALTQARQAIYDASSLTDISAELRDKYFEPVNGNFAFKKDLRRLVIFGRHDLVQDAPISRVDLLTCRNTLMYFNAETQERILTRFNFALNDGGYLFLGRAETMMTYAALFTPVDQRRRVSRKAPGSPSRERGVHIPVSGGEAATQNVQSQDVLRDASFELGREAKVVVDMNGTMILANERARGMFGVKPAEVGHPLQDLKISYQPVELRSLIDEAYATRRTVMSRNTEWTTPAGDIRWIDVHVTPLLSSTRKPIGVMATFHDVTISKRMQLDLESSNQDLEAAYEELQSTNEELETTNEELQSTVEELETTNEELQSANEELETMNEELQSANEELHAINEELRLRTEELATLNLFLESVLSGMANGVAVTDRQMRVVEWNRHSADLWGLRRDEVLGEPLLGLDIGLPLEGIKSTLHTVLNDGHGSRTVDIAATNRRGKAIMCRMTVTSLHKDNGEASGLILVMEELPPDTNGDVDGKTRSGKGEQAGRVGA